MMELDGPISVEIFKTKGYKDPRHHKLVYFKLFYFFKRARTAIVWEMSRLLDIDGLPDEIVWTELKTRKELKEATAGLEYYAVVKCTEPEVSTWVVSILS